MPLPNALAALEKRATGVFLLMLGAGLLFDGAPRWLGWFSLLSGAYVFGKGMLIHRHGTEPNPLTAPPEAHS